VAAARDREYPLTENWLALRRTEVGSYKPEVELLQGISQIHKVYS